jgi:translation initiation factor IF-2
LSLPLRAADDKPAQAKAREALQQKLKEIDAQPSEAPAVEAAKPKAEKTKKTKSAPVTSSKPATQPRPTPPAEPPPPTAVPDPVPASVPPPPATKTPEFPDPTPAPAAVPTAIDAESISKARDAMHQKVQELESPPPATAPGAAASATPVAVTVQPPAATPEPPAATAPAPESAAAQFAPEPIAAIPPQADPALIDKARDSMRKKLAEFPPGQEAEVSMPSGSAPKPKSGLKPLEPPALGISAEKQQRLSALLQRYKSDQITPEQYHAERAKVLAQ